MNSVIFYAVDFDYTVMSGKGSIFTHFSDTEFAHGFFIVNVLLFCGAEIIFPFFIDFVTAGEQHPGGM